MRDTMRARTGGFWSLVFGVDLKAPLKVLPGCGIPVTWVQAWSGVEVIIRDEGIEERVWLPRRKLGKRHEVTTTEEAATALAVKEGRVSGLPRWKEPKR